MNIMMEHEKNLHDVCMKQARHKILVIICEGNIPLAGNRQENNFKVDLKEIVCEDMDWFHLLQDGAHLWPIGNTEMHLQVP
jgi:hypothetical protein